jgi:hypothetical protein
MWHTTKKTRKQADERMVHVAQIPGHFSRGSRVFQNYGSFKSADWLHFLTTGILHVLKPMLKGKAAKALVALVRALRLALDATSDRDPFVTAFPEDDFNRRAKLCADLKLKIVELLVIYEDGVAISELPNVLHVLIHVPDAIYRWNSVRNMWCFTNER